MKIQIKGSEMMTDDESDGNHGKLKIHENDGQRCKSMKTDER